ncbi:secondary thiamine-phosphate synthase enzyme YjbQ [uncultured Methylobacterium sp.]|jgi:secondary thiamine-phosphate synthase enzyme|uniref:secondary thiamine-phosphate synthase enzyme YjbQ n=1 Tax=uncultured Methylobacterium sp. TaxID=157278 RepID=UPI00261A6D99|nr:secondary thiamine-phosphate synthase enzyme YjbQ [uncultured Methylobacterium sp.]
MRRDRVVGGIERIAEGAVTRQVSGQLTVFSRGRDFVEITASAAEFVAGSGVSHGLLTVFCRHTSASLTIQENADPDVRTDLAAALDRLAPRDAGYVHGIEGPDDMPAHIRTMLTGSSLSIPVLGGRLALGTWQGIYLVEHRDRPHTRSIVLHLAGA